MQRWSTSFKIRELWIETMLGYDFLPNRLAKIQHILLVSLWWHKMFSFTADRKQKAL